MSLQFNPFTGTFDVTTKGDTGAVAAAGDGSAAAPGITFASDTNTGIYRPGEDQLALSTGGTGRLFVDADGAVRVENNAVNTSPLFRVSTFNGYAEINSKRSTGGSYSQLRGTYAGNATDFWQIGSNGFTDGSFAIWAGANSQERLRITSAGLVGIGTSAPARTLDVRGSAVFNDGTVQATIWPQVATNVAGFGTNNNYPVALVTNGLQRLHVTAAGNVGIGTTSPDQLVHLSASTDATLRIESTSTALTTDTVVGRIEFEANDGSTFGTGIKAAIGAYSDIAAGTSVGLRMFAGSGSASTGTERYRITGDGQHIFGGADGISSAERARIDSSGRLLVGTSTSIGGSTLQVAGTGGNALEVSRFAASNAGPFINVYKSRGATTGTNAAVIQDDLLGACQFLGADGTGYQAAANIRAFVDTGTVSSTSMPGRLVFSTTSDASASPTERLRITSAGVLQVADAGNIAVGTTTGTKIGTATTQKLGFFNKTPVVQPAAVADATDAASVITQLNALLARMRDLGLIAT